MKAIAYLLLILVTFAVLFTSRQNIQGFVSSLKPCDQAITFQIGEVDARFNLSKSQVQQYAEEAGDIWNDKWQKPLFAYSKAGQISINMVYDQRQSQSNKINELDSQLDSEKRELDSQISDHRAKVADFKTRLQEHNAYVEALNAQGGASQDEYKKLVAQQKELEIEGRELNEQARQLNVSTEDYNIGVGNLNTEIKKFNQNLILKPEEGIFSPSENRIEIYYNNDKNELIHTIAHEFGHALNLEHVKNSKAIMYAYTSNTTTLTVNDNEQLEQACREKSLLEGLNERLQLLTSRIATN